MSDLWAGGNFWDVFLSMIPLVMVPFCTLAETENHVAAQDNICKRYVFSLLFTGVASGLSFF